MEGSNWEEVKKENIKERMAQMPTSSFHHDTHLIDEFVNLDDLLKETLPQLEEAVKEIEQQKEADQISPDEAQEGQKTKRMEKENRTKKMKKRACTQSLSQRNEFEGDSKKEHNCEIIGVCVAETYNGNQQSSAPPHTETALVEAQVRKNKHAKKKRKPTMGSKDLHTLSPPQRFETGSDSLLRAGNTQALVGDDSQTIMPSGNQSQVPRQEEIWEQMQQYLAMEVRLQWLAFIKDVYIAILHSLQATIKQTRN